ncbi:23S rRNA methyltransferase [Rhodococcoides trifolii]|uniref:23S rRNA methyltransferase n=1 Tax=Rhodococcoides trifolii TaxID=908250 RepID=A0A917FTZ6_9NOCA|nr:TRAM domain-containing protein [Rhodococcus trifolii]GGG08569.1 23S rRNA methyltransferase [Rhodococcus trifolii]
MSANWFGETFEVRVDGPAHGGFCVGRRDGRVVFVRHTLPGELVLVRVTEDPGKSFCRADAVEVLDPSPDRIPARCPISGPGASGCCDFSHVTPGALRVIKSTVVREQLAKIAQIDREVTVEALPGRDDGTQWRSRVRLAVDDTGRAGFHRFRSSRLVTDLRCPQVVPGLYDELGDASWRPDSELHVVVDSTGTRHVVESSAAQSRTARTDRGRRGAAARRAGASGPRRHRVLEGTGRPVERVGARDWELDATGFWQAHTGAADRYSDVVRNWSGALSGATAWDLYCGVGVFASVLADQVGPHGSVVGAEFSRQAVVDGRAALDDLPQVSLYSGRVERMFDRLPSNPSVVVLDPPRSGAGRDVVAGVSAAGAGALVHIGCDPAAFARDAGLYEQAGYRLTELRAFDAFPLTHHVEVIGLFTR